MNRRALLLSSLLFLSWAAAAQQAPVTLTTTVIDSAANETAGTTVMRAKITNTSDLTVERVQIIFGRDRAEVQVTDPNWICELRDVGLDCRHAPLPPHSEIELDVTLRFPSGAGRTTVAAFFVYQLTGMEARSASVVTFVALFRTFAVTNTLDDGAGSLRDAMRRLSEDPVCDAQPCRITFAIPAGVQGSWQTIHPVTPLPVIEALDLEIDGATQSDTNPLGPDIQLLAGNLREGDGVSVRGAERLVIRGLAIGYFPGNGISYAPPANTTRFVFEKNFIGVDPTGWQPLVNLGRGIAISGGHVLDSFIRDNVLSGNLRSGLFADTATRGLFLREQLTITGNRIGVAAHGEKPIPNGASGIFIGPGAHQVLVRGNVIAHNGHFGVSIALGAGYVTVIGNRMFENALLGIDIALDGPSPELANSYNVVPQLESARYDGATYTTIITGRLAGGPFGFYGFRAELYVNNSVDADGYAETEATLTTVTPDAEGRFTLTVFQNLRGKYVSAVTIRTINLDGSLAFDTSEVSRALIVQ